MLFVGSDEKNPEFGKFKCHSLLINQEPVVTTETFYNHVVMVRHELALALNYLPFHITIFNFSF